MEPVARAPFVRGADGRLVVTMTPGEQVLLRMLCTEIRELIASPGRDSRVGDRLFPTAYLDPTEEQAEVAWQQTAHDDLLQGKLAAFDDVDAFLLGGGEPGAHGTTVYQLDSEQEEHLLGACNDLRLVLAELIEGDPHRDEQPAHHDEKIDTRDLLDWLSALVSELVEVKLADLGGEA